MDKEDRAKSARKVRDTIFGEAYSEAKEDRLPVEDEIQRAVGDFAFGEVWSRPGLPIKTRSLITIAMLAAMYRTDQLRTHVKVALRIGVTPEEILETVMQVGVYGGLPTYGNARSVVRQIFKEQGILKG
jgi:alkylhydroperoxidase/carboxymuconolactone decarboxylase family protein YurZ